MATLTVYNAVRARIESDWTATPVAYPNEPFDLSAAVDGHWIALEFEGRMWSQASIGAGDPVDERWDETGVVLAHVMAPVGAGERTQRQHAEAFINLFRGTEIGAIEFQDAEIGPGGSDDNGNWWKLTATIDFVRRA